MATNRLKRVVLDNVPIPNVQGTATYRPTGEVLTPVADSNGTKLFDNAEPQVGMMKLSVSAISKDDEERVRNARGASLVFEFVDGKTVVGSDMSQSANNEVTEADGVLESEFMGNVKVR